MANGLTRPQQMDVVPVDVAASELAAVRALLEQLGDEVERAERAAVDAEQAGPTADVRSRDAVERLAATRRAELRAAEADARRIAVEQVLEATRRAQALAEASRREAAELLRDRITSSDQLAPLPEPPAASVAPADLPVVDEPTVPSPALSGWAAAPTAVASAPSVAAAWSAPESPATQEAHEQFWSEANDVARDSRAQKLAAPFAPIEALLPTIALVILLMAVLVLIG